MALVVFLRGLNVGGYRNFRPAALARQLHHLDAVNIGAAGTFVIRKPISRSRLHAEIKRRVPFEAEIAICTDRDIRRLISLDPFRQHRIRPDIVRFVSVLSRRPVATPPLRVIFRLDGKWLLKVLAHDGRFVVGLYRRHMKVIGYLGKLDRMFGMPVTTRNWNTITAINGVLSGSRGVTPEGGDDN